MPWMNTGNFIALLRNKVQSRGGLEVKCGPDISFTLWPSREVMTMSIEESYSLAETALSFLGDQLHCCGIERRTSVTTMHSEAPAHRPSRHLPSVQTAQPAPGPRYSLTLPPRD
ncbi:hypothetical protein FKM82_023469 [Ascaphus truei]